MLSSGSAPTSKIHDPLILMAHIIFKRVANWIAELENGENIELAGAVCNEAVADIIVLKKPLIVILEPCRQK
jgi:hypothetical protein